MIRYAIDQGNTLIKKATFQNDELIDLKTWSTENFRDEIKSLTNAPLIVCSVSGNYEIFRSILEPSEHMVITLDHNTPLPIINAYGSPQTLGMDRVAAVCGAKLIFPANNCLVIDIGSCITYDFINSSGQFSGGSISPGLKMRFKAMHQFTKGLPLVESTKFKGFTGGNTADSMISGVINGIVGEIEKFISLYRQKYQDLKIVFCGGDAPCFESMIKESIFAAPNLVLSGLHSILKHNEN